MLYVNANKLFLKLKQKKIRTLKKKKVFNTIVLIFVEKFTLKCLKRKLCIIYW